LGYQPESPGEVSGVYKRNPGIIYDPVSEQRSM